MANQTSRTASAAIVRLISGCARTKATAREAVRPPRTRLGAVAAPGPSSAAYSAASACSSTPALRYPRPILRHGMNGGVLRDLARRADAQACFRPVLGVRFGRRAPRFAETYAEHRTKASLGVG